MADLLADLRATRDLVEAGWTKGTLVVRWNDGREDGCAYCLDGAILAACGHEVRDERSSYRPLFETGSAAEVVDALHAHLPADMAHHVDPAGERRWSDLFIFNDRRTTTQSDVVALIDRAIATEEAR